MVAVLAGFTVPLMATPPAHAACDTPHTIYQFSSVRKSALMTNVRSAWADGGFTINYQENKTATVNASVTGTVSAEAGIVFAKASASIGVTVGGSWSKSSTWSYSAQVPKGMEGRIVMYRESRAFLVTKKRFQPPCRYVVVYRNAHVNAPVTRGDGYIFRMQLRSKSFRAKVDNDYFEKEIDLPPPRDMPRDDQSPR
ncbi:MAG TPA: hypothetical protein VHN14_20450 [Kofleriaceae bacterium]|jgi:hypothetical protein|nr:hypothetical protein [Kofleriaceae bacterium]